jgi:hypothetical protein
MKRSKLVFGLAMAGLAALLSCEAADRAFDCQSVCSRWKDCFDKDYDVGKCRDTCRAKAANDTQYEARADACEACIGDKSCIGSAASCTATCAPIISDGS